ncbi:MAG TPA: TerB family tellurite resistance protein [Candidatus Binatia bacterium]|nr:TerB family tellurite resistance protein [Candidatus Binatia bacterium]
MSLRRFLGLGSPAADGAAETATVRRIVAALERLDPGAARYIARFAYVLGRVAHADRETTAEETGVMERLVMQHGLPEEQAVLVVQIAKSQNLLLGATEDYLVTREFAREATREQKLALLACCFAVSAADRDVSGVEEAEIRQIASELGLEHADFIAARLVHREHLAVLKRPAGR